MFHKIKMAYQRAKYGFCDEDCWSISSHIATILPPMLRKMQKGVGCPCDFFDKDNKNNECQRWHEVLEEMAQGFEAFNELGLSGFLKMAKNEEGYYELKLDEEKRKQLTEKYERGMLLFSEHYPSLWD